jgi:hypothetical protein
MVEPFFISRCSTFDHQSSATLKAWTMNQSGEARQLGAKFGRVSTHPHTGEVVYEAWKEQNPETGAPRWAQRED